MSTVLLVASWLVVAAIHVDRADRARKRPPALVVFAWNAHNAPGTILRGLIGEWRRKGAADVIALNEVWTRRDELDAIARDLGMKHYQEQVGLRAGATVSERGSTAVLIARDVEVLARRVIVLTRWWWVFSAKRRHDGRRLERLRLRKAGVVYKLTVVHGPTNGPTGGNRWAFAEFLAVLVRAVHVRKGRVSVVVGDFNVKLSWLRPWAKRQDADVAGHNVDAAVVAGGTVTRKVLAKNGSDHAAVAYKVQPR